MGVNLSLYRNSKDTKGIAVTLQAVINRIRDGKRDLAEKTKYCNVLAATDKDKYRWYKENNLPAVTFSGTFPNRKRRAKQLSQHSGLVTIDIDNLTPNDTADLLAELAQMPQVVLAFVSPSGMGIKAIVRVDPIPQDALEHKGAFKDCADFFDDLATEYEFEIDTSGKDCSRLCYLSHDPLAIFHTAAPVIQWDKDEWLAAETEKQQRFEADTKIPYEGEVDITALDHIDPNDLDYNQWLSVITACKIAGISWQQADAWSQRGGVRYTVGEIESRWHGLNLDVSWGAVVNLAKQNGYIPPRRQIRKPVKLKKNVVSVITETLEKSREFLSGVFTDKKIKFFGLRADTGVGKNEAAITFFLRGFSGLVNVPTTKLAKELQARLDKAEIDSFRYRGIKSNPDGAFPDENPCIHAVRYDAIASRGWNAYALLCESCEAREVCEERGYRSQARQANEAQVTVMPFPDIFLNPAFRSLAKEFLPTYSDDLILHDEFDPYNAFLEINLPKSRLHQMRDDWEGYEPSTFAKEVLRILEVDGNLSELRDLVMCLTVSERAAILEGLTCVIWNGQVLSREDAHRCYEFIAKTHNTEQILTLPQIETDDWNLIVQLELFFQRYRRDADMPMKYENDTLTFLLPPLPMKTRARMGFMSATLNETLFRRGFDTRQEKRGDVSFHDTGLTQWHPEAKLYQLRTNRNPRRTVYQSKGESDEGLLSSTGADYWDLISDDLKNENRGLITYKALLDEKASELEGVRTANFGGLVGLDTHFESIEVLHILFSPEIPPSAVDFKAKALFGNDTEAISYERDEKGQYIDTRLQVCYDAGVISELEQGIGRGRLVSRPRTVIAWCSHYLPGITDRAQTRLFEENDWCEAGGIQGLDTAITHREDFEARTAELTAENTIADFQEVYGCSYERARQLWHEAGGSDAKDETDTALYEQIHALKTEKLSDSKIAKNLDISRGRLQALVKKYGAA